jgi:hypothetical protein
MKYFKDCQTVQDIKKEFRVLALQFHPDRGGDLETMKTINTEYAFAIANKLSGTEFQDAELKISEDFKNIIDALINLEGLVIELVGSWIWISGDTKPHKSTIKSLGMFWARKKEMWYYRPSNSKGGRGTKSFEQIKTKYGSQTVTKANTTSKSFSKLS